MDNLIIGTSQVRNVGSTLLKLKISAMCYTNPGCEIHHIENRIVNMVPVDYTGRTYLCKLEEMTALKPTVRQSLNVSPTSLKP